MSGYTPSEEEVRAAYVESHDNAFATSRTMHSQEFDRFLADDRRKTAVRIVADLRETLAGYFDFEKDPWEEYANPEPEDVWRLNRDLKAALERIEKGATDDDAR